MADKMAVDNPNPKLELIKDDSDESAGSSPELDPPPAQPSTTQESQQPKRKGGRKPIYATSEERKQRNRQAQAAFRERRTEYIKQLEETIRAHETNLHNLQAAHRTAADECLMLRYKNSLLERILLEKGIDVQAELRAKTGSPNLGPTHVPQNMVQPPPIQRVMMGRHQSRRSGSSIAPKLEPGLSGLSAASPKSRPTPSSHANSPTSAGPSFGALSAVSPTAADPMGLRTTMGPVLKQQLSPVAAMNAPRPPLLQNPTHARTPVGNAFYSTVGFQNHISELEQEYDAPDTVDDSELDTPSGPGPYPSVYATNGTQPIALSATAAGPSQQLPTPGEPAVPGLHPPGFPSMTQLLDSGLDWDPFGLSASMAFPAQFSFDPADSMR